MDQLWNEHLQASKEAAQARRDTEGRQATGVRVIDAYWWKKMTRSERTVWEKDRKQQVREKKKEKEQWKREGWKEERRLRPDGGVWWDQTPWTQRREAREYWVRDLRNQPAQQQKRIKPKSEAIRVWEQKMGRWGADWQEHNWQEKRSLALVQKDVFPGDQNWELHVWDLDKAPIIRWENICPLTFWKPKGPFKLAFGWKKMGLEGWEEGRAIYWMPRKCKICKEIVDFPRDLNLGDMDNPYLSLCDKHVEAGGEDLGEQWMQLWKRDPTRVWHIQQGYKWDKWEKKMGPPALQKGNTGTKGDKEVQRAGKEKQGQSPQGQPHMAISIAQELSQHQMTQKGETRTGKRAAKQEGEIKKAIQPPSRCRIQPKRAGTNIHSAGVDILLWGKQRKPRAGPKRGKEDQSQGERGQSAQGIWVSKCHVEGESPLPLPL